MLAILSPAKSLDLTQPGDGVPRTAPVFETDTARLLSVMKKKSPKKLKALMGISDTLATLNHGRYQVMTVPPREESLPAAMLFAGDVYRGLDARSLDAASLAWAQEHIGILSGLYGLLRPLDRTEPYRLEMGSRLKTRRGEDLYAFWGKRIAVRLDEALDGHAESTVVNLASGEYARSVKRKALRAGWVDVVFKEIRDGKPKIISFFAKHARGAFARWMIEERIDTRDRLPEFARDGYRFDPDASSDSAVVFTRASSA